MTSVYMYTHFYQRKHKNIFKKIRNNCHLYYQGIFGTIQPDQMQAFNSLFVLVFIPLFEEIIYPILNRYNCLTK